MSTSPDPRREYSSTYIVQDRSNEEEMQRLHMQDQMMNASMGGLLPEQDEPERFQRVLDVGCGTGGWLIELAKAYPRIERLIGIDVNRRMIEFAHAQAEAQGVGDRVEFLVMDALLVLEFPDGFFDLVNQRFGVSYLRTWDWPRLLGEYLRITRPRGVIRVTEDDIPARSDSKALLQLGELALQALYRAGHFFHCANDGIIRELEALLRQQELKNVQTRMHALEFRGGTPQGQLFAEDMQHLLRTMKPFLQKWSTVPDDYEEIYQRMVRELNEPDCTTIWNILTAWGSRA
jgi:ubiquinone/menaquinone biosynthesis C-methylase UbiE